MKWYRGGASRNIILGTQREISGDIAFAGLYVSIVCNISDIHGMCYMWYQCDIEVWPPKNEQGIFRDINNLNLHKKYPSLVNFYIHWYGWCPTSRTISTASAWLVGTNITPYLLFACSCWPIAVKDNQCSVPNLKFDPPQPLLSLVPSGKSPNLSTCTEQTWKNLFLKYELTTRVKSQQ